MGVFVFSLRKSLFWDHKRHFGGFGTHQAHGYDMGTIWVYPLT